MSHQANDSAISDNHHQSLKISERKKERKKKISNMVAVKLTQISRTYAQVFLLLYGNRLLHQFS